MVDIIGLTRLWALSFVDSIGMWTLSLKYDGGHYRTVGTIIGKCNQYLLLALSQGWQWSWTVGTFRSGQQGPFLQDLSAKIAIFYRNCVHYRTELAMVELGDLKFR